MVIFARMRLEYADSVIRTGGNREAVSAELVQAVTQQVGNITAINPDTATDLIALVESSPIMEDDKRAIVIAVQGKVNVAAPPFFVGRTRTRQTSKFPQVPRVHTIESRDRSNVCCRR